LQVNLGDDDVIEMARSLLKMDSLVELALDLKDNKIKQRSAQVLGQCLNELKNLKVCRGIGRRKS
jgi:Ran GTPase-activating protein (RanGAP) involved in mRNA processing and transport